jgi:hypothetical protein
MDRGLTGMNRDLLAILRGHVPLVVLETRDEARAVAQVVEAARALNPPAPVFEWTVTSGLRRLDVDLGGAQGFNAQPERVLTHLLDAIPGVYVMLDLHPYLTDPTLVRLVKDVCLGFERSPRTIVLVSHDIELPADLAHLAARVELAYPDAAARRAIVDDVAREWVAEHGQAVRADETSIRLLVENLAGLPEADVRRLARTAIFHDGAITADDVPLVAKAKYELLARGGVLSFEYDTMPVDALAGMGRVKEWLRRRRPAFDGSAPDLSPPRGLLLLGVQGCGKSLAAKVAASVLGVPLLRMDLAGVHDKYVGESERRLRESLATADVMAPCVVWIDEIEKGLAASDGDAGAAQRVLGTFLTWLAEKRGRVFVVATANDISRLPPELVRKGRFDEIFFVDLPSAEVRAQVFGIHAAERGIALGPGDLAALAAATEGFSGAEIEQVVVSAAYAAHDDGGPVNVQHLLREAAATRPLSVVMAEQVAALRAWARPRTVPAD